jgi:hypothetical protein
LEKLTLSRKRYILIFNVSGKASHSADPNPGEKKLKISTKRKLFHGKNLSRLRGTSAMNI